MFSTIFSSDVHASGCLVSMTFYEFTDHRSYSQLAREHHQYSFGSRPSSVILRSKTSSLGDDSVIKIEGQFAAGFPVFIYVFTVFIMFIYFLINQSWFV